MDPNPRYLEAVTHGKLPFDYRHPDPSIVRLIFLERLRRDASWNQLNVSGDGFDHVVEFSGANEPDRQAGRRKLNFLIWETFWQFVVEGIVAPGMNAENLQLPWFHVTSYGRQVLNSAEPQPYDPIGYLATLRVKIERPDETVMAYLAESLATFGRGNQVASSVMLGIAAERVFLLVCTSLSDALSNSGERKDFLRLLERFPMKPKLDWVLKKIQHIEKQGSLELPDNVTTVLLSVYDLMRCQRNELGHPREAPPRIDRQDAFTNLQVFARFYAVAERVRSLLANSRV